MMNSIARAGLLVLLAVTPAQGSTAQTAETPFMNLARYVTREIQPWANDPIIVEALRAQNAASAALSQRDIERLDSEWRQEVASTPQPLISDVLSRPLSAFLRQKQTSSGGQMTEVFVMDNRGLNVGQSIVTSDYWQGDEAKWKNSFGAGPHAVFIDDIRHDDSTGLMQSQVSLTIRDPATGQAIGALTVGLRMEGM